jgi:hypothetical protein
MFRKNENRAVKLVKRTMKSIEDHQDLLVEAKANALRKPAAGGGAGTD